MTSLDVAVAVIVRGERVFLQRRAADARHFPGVWELPGGKVEAGETPQASLLRELGEELGWRPSRVAEREGLLHAYPEFTVRLHCFRCEGGEPPRAEAAWGWFLKDEILRLPLPEATRKWFEAFSG